MTLDERIDHLMGCLPYTKKTSGGVKGFEQVLRQMFQQAVRDQRYACAEAVMTVAGDSNNPWMIDKDAAHSAVMNASLTSAPNVTAVEGTTTTG